MGCQWQLGRFLESPFHHHFTCLPEQVSQDALCRLKQQQSHGIPISSFCKAVATNGNFASAESVDVRRWMSLICTMSTFMRIGLCGGSIAKPNRFVDEDFQICRSVATTHCGGARSKLSVAFRDLFFAAVHCRISS